MDDAFQELTNTQEVKEPQPAITFGEIFSQIWTSPRDVFRRIEESTYEKYMFLLIILGSIDQTFDRAMLKNMGDKLPLAYVIIICLVVGILFGWLSYMIGAAILRWVGSKLGGEASFKSVLRVLAYSSVPSILTLTILSFQLVIFGEAMFKSEGYVFEDFFFTDILMLSLFFATILIQLALGIWSFVISINGLSVVQNFSRWRALGSVLLSGLLIVGILLVLIMPIIFLYLKRY